MIKNFSTWVESLLEKKNATYDFGCAMLYFDMPQMVELQSKIKESDLYTEEDSFGFEDEPHVTLLYGFHKEVDPMEVLKVCDNFKYDAIKLHNISFFDAEKYDVLKFDAENPVLHQVNAEIKQFPHTTNFPDYHPHATVAYLKKGKGQHYVDLFKGAEYYVVPDKIVYSMPNGTRKVSDLS